MCHVWQHGAQEVGTHVHTSHSKLPQANSLQRCLLLAHSRAAIVANAVRAVLDLGHRCVFISGGTDKAADAGEPRQVAQMEKGAGGPPVPRAALPDGEDARRATASGSEEANR